MEDGRRVDIVSPLAVEKDHRLEQFRSRVQPREVFKSNVELGSQESGELLPGIFDDKITLHHVTSKLSWRESRILSSVSQRWLKAIRNHEVYEAKVRSQLTNTFVVITGRDPDKVILRSLEDNSSFQLPPISHLRPEILHRWQLSVYTVLNGKIYVLGGALGAKVYVFDLVGQGSWTSCASMCQARSNFSCGVLDGKIYVFGGRDFRRLLCGSEVYDPKENTWNSINRMCSSGVDQVAELNTELVVCGTVYEDRVLKTTLEFYDPVTDVWTTKTPSFDLSFDKAIFGAHGKLHRFDRGALLVHDFEENNWTLLTYSHSIIAIDSEGAQERDFIDFRPCSVTVIGNELLARGYLLRDNHNGERYGERFCVLKSNGFNSAKNAVKWREVRDWPTGSRWTVGSVCSLQL